MASLEQRLTAAMQAIGADHKAVRAAIGPLASLQTSDKSSVTAAINELASSSGDKAIAVTDFGLGQMQQQGRVTPGQMYLVTDFGWLAVGVEPDKVEYFYNAASYPRPPWAGRVAACWGDGDPVKLGNNVVTCGAGVVQASSIGVSEARVMLFSPQYEMYANALHWMGGGQSVSAFWAALYEAPAANACRRLHAPVRVDSQSGAWGRAPLPSVHLRAGRTYAVAFSASSASTRAYTPLMASASSSASAGWLAPFTFPDATHPLPIAMRDAALPVMGRFAVSGGALPDVAAFTRPATVWSGGVPAFWVTSS